MHSTRPSIPPRPRRFDTGRRVEVKPSNHTAKREDKNNVNHVSSPRHVTRAPPEPFRFRSTGPSPRAPVTQPRLFRQQKNGAQPVAKNVQPKAVSAASNQSPAVVDPNCNEPSLPCLCCDGHPPQDSNSLFNHNHNNNNTVAIRQQLKLVGPLPKNKELEKKPEIEQKAKCKPEEKEPVVIPVANQVEDKEEEEAEEEEEKEENGNVNEKEADHKEDDPELNVNGKVDENGNDNNDIVAAQDVVVDDDDDDDDDDDEDDNTLVPSCCDCPASMLDFSLTSSTSSSSTSISSCSDLESDCPDSFSVSLQEQEHYPVSPSSGSNTFQPCSLPLDLSTSVRPPLSPCSPDEGYPSGPLSPSSDFQDSKEPEEGKAIKVDLLNFLDSIDELGKVDRFYRIVQLAHWELECDMDLRDRLVHQERIEKVNKQVKLVHLERLQEAGLDLDEEDLSGVLDEMGNIDISWKMYKSDKSCDSQEFSDAGVDMTGPSDLDEPPAPDSLVPSPVEPPPRPPKPPARHISAQPELHTYINISSNTSSVSSPSSPVKSFTLSVAATLTTSQASKPPALPPAPSQPVPYFTLYSDSPSISSPAPPIPPPRRRHKARLEAQRLAELEKMKMPQSLPAPTSRPPPLPPPPVVQPSPPAIPPPPSLPPPPSFHALDVEIRKLLALAGITQAELLRLSPELGVCVDGVLEEGEMQETLRKSKEDKEDLGRWSDESSQRIKVDLKDVDTVIKEEVVVEENKNTGKETFRTTSFTEMARRRKRIGGSGNSSCGCGLGDDVSLSADSYYSTDIGNKHFANASFGSFDYASVIPDSPPPPPPPRPLPPRPQIVSNPPELPPLKPCTLPANASRPDRFDWLIAFTPDTETPHLDLKRSSSDAVPQKTTGTKVTTFKELRNRSKQASPPSQVQPEPEPTVVTPDPDFLYNLKWRREKTDGDGSQWEYTSQAQATFLQPPPTPASLALFREMRHLDIQGEASPVPYTRQKSAYSASHNLSDFSNKKRESNEDVALEKTEVRGTADGGRTWESRTRAVRSLSFAGAEIKGAWMGSDVRTPQRGLSSLCLQEKRALVSAVSVAVEAILAQFSSSRTLVQKFHSVDKALSGDSSVNPTLGRLVLQCLCPALRDLISDGLKPHQSDLIAGRRPNSPWGLVQASTKPGSCTQALYSLQMKVAALPQLKHNRHRFNSFLLGLLNIKRLDFWLSHLQSCSDVLETFYHPMSFMRLSSTSCQPLFDELLLLLQPLSLLTFNLDLLFQHHHLDPSSPDLTPTSHNSSVSRLPNRGFSFHLLPTSQSEDLKSVCKQGPGVSGNLKTNSFRLSPTNLFGPSQVQCKPVAALNKEEGTSPQLQWLKEKHIEAPPSDVNENSLAQQAGQALQQGWGAVMRWGERLGQNLGGLASINSAEEVEDVQTPGQEADAVPWGLGRLFGASKSPNNPPTKRRPSQWLSPGISVLSRMTSGGHIFLPEKIEPVRKGEIEKEKKEETGDQPKPLRMVRTLCDYTGMGTELSFRKGEELIVLGGVDQDWIRCRQDNKEGLVPIGYASLII